MNLLETVEQDTMPTHYKQMTRSRNDCSCHGN